MEIDQMRKNNINPKHHFKTDYASNLKQHNTDFRASLSKARDKHVAFEEFRSSLIQEYLKEQKIYPKIDQAIEAIKKRVALDKSLTFDQALEQSQEFNQIGSAFSVLVSSYLAKQTFLDFLHNHPLNYPNDTETDSAGDTDDILKWDSGFNQRDFLKIFYALKEAGCLKGDITRIVPHVARVLNFNLNSEWRSNFSKGLHKNNTDFKQGKIFDTLKSAFESYANTQIANHLKRTNKKN